MDELVNNLTSVGWGQYAIEYPESGDPMYALAIIRRSESGGALHATLRFIVPRGRSYSSVCGVISGLHNLLGGSIISLDHSCAAPARASLDVVGLRGGPSGVYQLAENPCEVFIIGLTILANLEMSNFLRASCLCDK